MKQLSRVVLAGTLLVAACGDEQRAPTSPFGKQPSGAISDGASGTTGANKDFFFLPPLVPNPGTHENFDAGRFHPLYKPVVQICKGAEDDFYDESGACKHVHLEFKDAEVAVRPDDELYQVDWKTDEARGLDEAAFYRIRVLLEGTEIGFSDIDPVTRDEMKNAETGATVPLVEGRTLPIKFRVEAGVLTPAGYEPPDYVIQKVPATGGTVKTAKEWAGAFFPDGWLNEVSIDGQPITAAYVVIERQYVGADNRCHTSTDTPYALVEFEGCYKYNTFPDFGAQPFGKAAIVRNCPEIDVNNPLYKALRHYKSDVDEPVTVLPEAVPPFALECPIPDSPPPQAPRTTGSILDRAGAGWQRLAFGFGKVFGPRPLYAVDLGAGGETFRFSNIGLGIERNISLLGSSSISARPGTEMPVSVLVWGAHSHKLADGSIGTDTVPLSGQVVSFTASAGSIAGTGGVTDANGTAQVIWTIPEGAATLTASVVQSDNGLQEAEVTANGDVAAAPAFTVTGTITDVDDPNKVLSLSNGYGLLAVPSKGFVGNTTALNGVYNFSYSPTFGLNWAAGESGTLTASHPGYASRSEPFTIPSTTTTITQDFALKRVDLFHATSEKETLDAPPAKPDVGTWSVFIPNGSTATIRARGTQQSKHIEINQPDGSSQAPDLIGTIVGQAPTTGLYSVKWTATVASQRLEFAYVTVGTGIGTVEFRPNGVISYNTAAGQNPVPTNARWVAGTPQSFELVVNLTDKLATLLVDDTPVVSNAKYLVTGATLSRIGFNMGGTSAQVLNYDSISIGPVTVGVR